MIEANTQRAATMTERRMDVEFTVEEIDALYVLAIRERARTRDQEPNTVNLARKLAEYRRRALP
jgi:hypothetical protein